MYSVKQMDRLAYVVSAIVLVLVVMMRRVKIDTAIDFSFLPPFHASLNAITAVILIMALVFIKQKNIKAHKFAIMAAMVTSVLFLGSYVLYHFTTEETHFCQEGSIRIVYFVLLISHILFAAISLPFILLTFNRGFKMETERHKKLARWVYPMWLYVAISGPVCYLMLKPCYL